MLDADAAVAVAVFGLEHLISYCNGTKRCFGPTSRRRHSRGERESLHSPQLDGRGMLRVTTKALACNCWGTDSDTSTPCVTEPRRCHVYCCTAVTAVVSS